MYKVVRWLNLHSKYNTLNQLTIDWSNIALKDIVLTSSIKLIDNFILKYLNILIIELWVKINDKYNIEGQIILYTLWEQGTVYANFIMTNIAKVPVLVLVLVPRMQIKINMLVVILVPQILMKMNMLIVVLVMVVMLIPRVQIKINMLIVVLVIVMILVLQIQMKINMLVIVLVLLVVLVMLVVQVM